MGEIKRVTKSWWDELQGKPKWDIQVALRGPDCHNSEGIKWFTTAVIRGMMSKAIRVGGTVNDDLRLIVVPTWNPYSEGDLPKSEWNYEHFFDHVVTAAHWLSLPILTIPLTKWWEVRLHGAGVQGYCMLEWAGEGTEEKKELKRHLEEAFPGYAPSANKVIQSLKGGVSVKNK